MNDFCKNCNAELNGAAFCPHCGTKAERETVQQTAPPVQETVAYAQQPQQTYAQPAPQPAQPSAFAMMFKQSFNVIKNFFSKNIVDAVTCQYAEKLNIWIVLLSIPALLCAISGCIHYDTTATDILSIAAMPYSAAFGRVGWFFAGMFFSLALEFSFVIVLFLYSKLIKKKPLSFTASANLVAAAYLPITVVSASYVVLGSNMGVALLIAVIMFVYLLQKGMQKAFDEEKAPFWSFYLFVAAAIATFIIASAVISVPGWISNAAYSVSSPLESLFDSYNYYSYY